MAELPAILHADASTMFATWRSIAMPVFGFKETSALSARVLGRMLETHGRSIGKGKLLEVTWLDEHTGMPSSEVRSALEEMVPRVSPYYGSVGAVFEGDGFKSAMIRGLLTSFQLLSRGSYPQKTFATLDTCAAWTYANGLGLGADLGTREELETALRYVVDEGIRLGILSPRR